MDASDWVFEQNEIHYHHYHRDYDDRELDAMVDIWNNYHDEFGEIDWHDHTMYDSAWYYFMSEVMGLDDETIERYA